eukprot:GHVO01053539.1.p1 GENE.GHVO01053539.1~~GHVO01053539.1.p1  ORF type:complete len:154 (-),score=6.86 GHVO01053539.1:477-893(-)
MRHSDPVFTLVYKILSTIAKHQREEGFSVPTPWINGINKSLDEGLNAFQTAYTIKNTPFPFVYIQLLYIMDLGIMILTPILASCYLKTVVLGVILTILIVFCSHALYTAAFLMECPFGLRKNDVPLLHVFGYSRYFGQ